MIASSSPLSKYYVNTSISQEEVINREVLCHYLFQLKSAGSTTITALQAEDNNYNSASATMTLTILKKDLSVAQWYPTSTITRTFGIPPFEIVDPIVASDYIGTFNFRSSDPSIASVSSRTVTINSIGYSYFIC